MPKKSQKKKNEQLKDFAKKKLKVGKTAQKADSFTDTSFTSRAILVPDQQIATDKSDEVTNSKNQTLADLLVQIKNYSAYTRRDAINGIADMLVVHPELFRSAALTVIIHALSKCFVDDERIVRKTLAAFCQDFFSTMTTEQMRPFITVTMAYVSSAMNHIYEDIRLDGLNFLDVFVNNFPELIEEYAEKAGFEQIIPNFISLITTNYGQERRGASDIKSIIVNPNSKIGSEKSRLHALQSFHQFIFQLLRRQESEYWYLEDYGVAIHSLVPHAAFSLATTSFKLLALPPVQPFIASIFSFATTKDLTLAAESRIKIGLVHSTKAQTAKQEIKNQYHLDHIDELENLICILLPAMIDFWIEAYPIAFPVGVVAVSSSLMILDTLIRVLNLIWRSYFILLKTTDSPQQGLVTQRFYKLMDKHITTHFPFGTGAQLAKDGKLDALLQQMNIQYAEILCHFLKLPLINTLVPKQKMLAYVDSLLSPLHKQPRYVQELPQLVSLLKFENLKAALPMIWKSVENGFVQDRDTLLTALFTYFDNQPTLDPSKYALFRFIARILLLQQHPQYTSTNYLSTPTLLCQTKHFIEHLPKLLWNLKQTHKLFTREILWLLVSVFKANLFAVHNDKPFLGRFTAKYQSVFKVDTQKNGSVYGPFVGIDNEARMMALDVCFYLPLLTTELLTTVVSVLSATFIDADLAVYFMDLLERRNVAEQYFSALLTLCVVGMTRLEAQRVRGELSAEAFYKEKRAVEDGCMLNSLKRKRVDESELFQAKRLILAEYAERIIRGLEPGLRGLIQARFSEMKGSQQKRSIDG